MNKISAIPESYPYPVFEDMNRVIRNIASIVPHFRNLYTDVFQKIAIVCRGTSGIILATELVKQLPEYKNLQIKFVRKKGENAHSYSSSINFGVPIVVIDDFISSGSTMSAIAEEIGDYIDQVETAILQTEDINLLSTVFPNLKNLIN